MSLYPSVAISTFGVGFSVERHKHEKIYDSRSALFKSAFRKVRALRNFRSCALIRNYPEFDRKAAYSSKILQYISQYKRNRLKKNKNNLRKELEPARLSGY